MIAVGCDGIFEKETNESLMAFLLSRLRTKRRQEFDDASDEEVESPETGSDSDGLKMMRSKKKNFLSEICEEFLDHNVAASPVAEGGLGCDNMSLMLIQPSKLRKLPLDESSPTADAGEDEHRRTPVVEGKALKRVKSE